MILQGQYEKLAIQGGVVGINIQWNCDLDWDFMKYCLPAYSFRLLDQTGWNFRYAKYHEENRRTLIKTYGIKFLISVNGKAGKFDMTNTVILLITGLGLLGLANILCDFVLLHCSNRFRREIMEKKYEAINQEDEQIAKSLKSWLQSGDPNASELIHMNEKIFETLNDISSIAIPPTVHQNSSTQTPRLQKNKNSNHEIILLKNDGLSH